MKHDRNPRRAAIAITTAVATAAALVVGVGLPANADNGTDTSALRDAVSAEGIIDHLDAL